ncbi:MAG: class I SAM-dependent methyltransferase [Gammaproteobacteria bacterium]
MLCKICQNNTTTFWLTAKGFNIGKCSYCGFAQALEVPTEAELDELYELLHAKHIKYRSDLSASIENQRRISFLKRHITDGSKVLDAGCASGDFMAIGVENFEMYGSDISTSAIEYAKKRLPELSDRLKAHRLEDDDLVWQDFDAVCLWDVIEHVADPVCITQLMMNKVKPGGYLFISTPDFGSLMAKLMRSNWAFMTPPYHLGYFTKQAFKYLFKNNSLGEIIRYETKGKTVDLSFLMYKLNQMNKWLSPEFLLNWIAKSKLGRIKLYIPTNDIAYLVIQKPSVSRVKD